MSAITALIFPLPNLVYFPVLNKPLNIFEPRYLKLVDQAVSDDQYIALCMGLHEEDGDAVAIEHESLHYVKDICGVGKVQVLERRLNGELTILVKPVLKMRLHNSVASPHGFNIGTGREIIDFDSIMPDNFLIHNQLKNFFLIWAKNYFKQEQEYIHLRDSIEDPSVLVALICEFVLTTSLARQQVLELDDINDRVSLLADYLFS